jgi:cobalt-zinc-cadmium efflux system outer membrane protein
MMSRSLLLAALAFTVTGCSSAMRSYDDVAATVTSRTGKVVPSPARQLSGHDVNREVSFLLTRSLTANTAAQIALLNSRRVRATLEELNLSQADLLEASLPSNPTLSSSVRWPSGGGGSNSEFGLAADVLNLLLLPLRRRLALHEYEAAKRRVSHELLEVVFETKEAFYELQAAQHLLNRLKTAAEVNQVSSDMARRLREAGNITELELLQEQTNSQQAAVEITRANGEVAAARERVNRLLGLTSSQARAWRFSENLPAMPGKEPSLASLESAAVANRQDLAAEAEIVVALEQGYSLTRKMRYFPAFNVGVDTEREVEGERLTGPTLEVELPLFNQGQGRLMKATAELAKARASHDALELEIRSDVRSALQRVQLARQLHQQLSSVLLPQRQRILAETLLQYNAMQVSTFELLQAKSAEIEAERAVVEALRDYWVARGELEKAAGGSLKPARVVPAGKAPAQRSGVHVH